MIVVLYFLALGDNCPWTWRFYFIVITENSIVMERQDSIHKKWHMVSCGFASPALDLSYKLSVTPCFITYVTKSVFLPMLYMNFLTVSQEIKESRSPSGVQKVFRHYNLTAAEPNWSGAWWLLVVWLSSVSKILWNSLRETFLYKKFFYVNFFYIKSMCVLITTWTVSMLCVPGTALENSRGWAGCSRYMRIQLFINLHKWIIDRTIYEWMRFTEIIYNIHEMYNTGL